MKLGFRKCNEKVCESNIRKNLTLYDLRRGIPYGLLLNAFYCAEVAQLSRVQFLENLSEQNFRAENVPALTGEFRRLG
jgi:hypothetical protein